MSTQTLDVEQTFINDMVEKYYKINMIDTALSSCRDAYAIYEISHERDVVSGPKYLSPNIASMSKSDSYSLPFNEFLSICRIDKTLMHRHMNIIESKKPNIVFIGYGGMSINMISFINKLRDETNIRPFNSLTVYEPDKLSLTNLFRVYKDCSKIGYGQDVVSKLDVLDSDRYIANTFNPVTHYFKKEDLDNWDENTIFIGAPDFETRELLKDRKFYFVGHGGNEVSITYQPSTDMDLAIETYGRIDVRILWANLLRATAFMLKELSKDISHSSNTLLFECDSSKRIRPERSTQSMSSTF